MNQVGSYLGQGNEHEGPLAEHGMRDPKAVFVQDLITVKQNIKVDLPRTPLEAGAPAEAGLYPLQLR
jgi:hypothetical protein